MKVLKIFLLLLMAPVLAMASGQSGGGTQSGQTVVTMAVRMHATESQVDWNAPLGKLITQKTNIRVEAEYWPEVNIVELSNLRLASGSLPDLTYVSPQQASIYGMDGVFDPLDNLLKMYAPNITRYMTPINSVTLKAPDGKMYQIGKFDGSAAYWPRPLDYRMDILQEMGEQEPSTVDGWYQLFKRVKARYPNMIPLVERSRRIDDFAHTAWDMGKIWNENYYGIIGSELDRHEVKYLPMTQEWKDMLQWYARLYEEDLLDRGYLTQGGNYDDWWERKIGGGIAFACWTMNHSRAGMANDLAHEAGFKNIDWGCARTVEN